MFIRRTTAWSMWFTVSLFYAYQYILRVMPNIMMNDIMRQYKIDAITFGQFSGIYYIGYALMHVPLGIMLDRYGPKKVVPVCMILTSLGLLPILCTNIWIYPIIGRALIGMGSSAAILGTFKVIRLAFSEDKFTRMLSFSVTIGLMGAIYGGGPVNYMCAVMGYRGVVALFTAMGAGLAVIAYIIMPSLPREHRASSLSSIKEVFLSGRAIAVCLLSGFLVGPLEGFADVWAGAFLRNVYGLTAVVAASLPSAIFLGMCFGGPLISFIAEKTKNYLATIAAAGLVMMAIFTALVAGIMPVAMMSIAFVVVGICCAYQIIAIYTASTYVKKDVIGLTTAVANMIIMLFGYLFHATIGWTISKTGGIGSAHALVCGISIIPITLVLGSLGFIVLAFCSRRNTGKVT